MKAINFIITMVQGFLVAAYILFYNVQYYWSLKSTVHNIIYRFICRFLPQAVTTSFSSDNTASQFNPQLVPGFYNRGFFYAALCFEPSMSLTLLARSSISRSAGASISG